MKKSFHFVPIFRTPHLRISGSSSPWLMFINIIHTHFDVITFTLSSPKHDSNDLDCQQSTNTWMNWMVMADFPTPPPPTTTILYLFWFILCSLSTSLALPLGHLLVHLLDHHLGHHLDHLPSAMRSSPPSRSAALDNCLSDEGQKLGAAAAGQQSASSSSYLSSRTEQLLRRLWAPPILHPHHTWAGAAQYCLRHPAPSLGKFQSRNIVLRGRASAATNCLVIHRIKTVQGRCSNISRDYLLVERSISREFRIGDCLVNWTSECWGSFPLNMWCLWNDCNDKRKTWTKKWNH